MEVLKKIVDVIYGTNRVRKKYVERNPDEKIGSLQIKEGETAASFYKRINRLLHARSHAENISFLTRLKSLYTNDSSMVEVRALFNGLCSYYKNYMNDTGFGYASQEYLPVCFE